MHKIAVEYFDPADGAAFEASYRARHVPLVKQLPGLERFTLSFPSTPGAPNLVAELWFADGDALAAARTSPQMASVAADSETYEVARRVIFAASVEEVCEPQARCLASVGLEGLALAELGAGPSWARR